MKKTTRNELPAEVPSSPKSLPHSELTLMIQFSQGEARMTLITGDGKLEPQHAEGEQGTYSTPCKIALIKERFFAYGHSALTFAKRAKTEEKLYKQVISTDVWQLVKTDTESNVHDIVLHETKLRARSEVLIALFIRHLKSVVEDGLYEKINQVVFCVPLWFGSLHRKRLKESAEIAGFGKSFIVNETTTIAYLHQSSHNLPGKNLRNFLVLNEKSGNLELAYYRKSGEASLEMVAVTGNLFESPDHFGRFVKRRVATYKTLADKNREKFLHHLLWELITKIGKENKANETYHLELLCFCDDREWVHIFKTAVNRPVKEDDNWKLIFGAEKTRPVILYEHLGAPPIVVGESSGRVNDTWNPPRFSLVDFFSNTVSDLIPYHLLRTEVISKSTCLKIMDCDMRVNNERMITIILPYPTTKTIIYQNNVLYQSFVVGSVNIPRIMHYKFFEFEIKLEINREGILHLDSVWGCNVHGKPVKLLECPEDYYWRPSNLTTSGMNDACAKFRELLSLEETYLEAIERKESLYIRCQAIDKKIMVNIFKIKRPSDPARLHIRVKDLAELLKPTDEPLLDFEFDDLDLDELVREVNRYETLYVGSE